jgi:hypothetical protein
LVSKAMSSHKEPTSYVLVEGRFDKIFAYVIMFVIN